MKYMKYFLDRYFHQVYIQSIGNINSATKSQGVSSMITATQQDMVVFASRFGLTPSQAAVLPALFEKAAAETGNTVRGLLATATYHNIKAGEYLASVARQVAEEMQVAA